MFTWIILLPYYKHTHKHAIAFFPSYFIATLLFCLFPPISRTQQSTTFNAINDFTLLIFIQGDFSGRKLKIKREQMMPKKAFFTQKQIMYSILFSYAGLA